MYVTIESGRTMTLGWGDLRDVRELSDSTNTIGKTGWNFRSWDCTWPPQVPSLVTRRGHAEVQTEERWRREQGRERRTSR